VPKLPPALVDLSGPALRWLHTADTVRTDEAENRQRPGLHQSRREGWELI
jgi:hypothetical protein